MRFLRHAFIVLNLFASIAFASSTDPRNGVEYNTLRVPQATQIVGKKIEVIEFFMYHCPFCNSFEPYMNDWLKKRADVVNFRRIHFQYSGPQDPEARLFLTLEAMDKEEAMHAKIFNAIHNEHSRFFREEATIFEWVAANGVDKAKFIEAWKSFGVVTKMKRLGQIYESYGASHAPSVVIDGRFITSPADVSKTSGKQDTETVNTKTIEVLDHLLNKALNK